MKTIYLAGPIDGVTPEWATEWRKQATTALKDRYHILDPTEGKDLHAAGCNDSLYTPEYIVETDLAMIRQADVLLVDWRELDTREACKIYDRAYMNNGSPVNFVPPRVGTSQELVYAKQWGKQVIAFGTLRRGYWLQYHSDKNFDTLELAIKYLRGE